MFRFSRDKVWICMGGTLTIPFLSQILGARRNHRREAVVHPVTGAVHLLPGHRTAHTTVPPGTVRPEQVEQLLAIFDSPLDLPRDISSTQSSNTLGSMEQTHQSVQTPVSDVLIRPDSTRLMALSRSGTSFDSPLFYLFDPASLQEPPALDIDWEIRGEVDSCRDISLQEGASSPTDLPSTGGKLLGMAECATQEVIMGVSIISNTYGSGQIVEWWNTPLATSDPGGMKDLSARGSFYDARPSSTSTARRAMPVPPSPRATPASSLAGQGVALTDTLVADTDAPRSTTSPPVRQGVVIVSGDDKEEKSEPDATSNEARASWEELKWRADREYDERLHREYALSVSEQAQEDSVDVMEMETGSDLDSVVKPVSDWEELKQIVDWECEERLLWDLNGTDKHPGSDTLESMLGDERLLVRVGGGDQDGSRVEVLLADDSPSLNGGEGTTTDAGIVVTAPIVLGTITRASLRASISNTHAGKVAALHSSKSTASI